ncbi:MAG: MFS transporter [Eggerthellaceae bacterium]|jgi:MFS family permease|nr:MFS transporter [Eggerthellaceae bacterium]
MENKKFFGWPLTVVLGIMYFCSSGFVLSTAQIVNPLMMQDPSMGLSGTLLGTGFSLFVLMQGIPSPFVGWLIGKKGARFTMIVGGAVMLLSALAMVFVVRDAITYFIFFGVFLSVSTIMAGQISVQSTVGQWFIAKRGLAMSVMMGIGGLASFVAPLVVNYVINASGGSWQAGWYLLIALAVVLILLALLVVKDQPSDIGQLPDGGADAKMEAEGKSFKVYKNTNEVTYGQAIKSPYFWLIALAGSGGFCAFSLATSQGVINFTSLGFDTGVIVGAAAVMGIASLIGKLALGLVSDAVEPVRIIGVALVVLAVGVVCGAMASNPAMIYIYYICTGLGFGTIATNLPTTVANYFGVTAFSKNLSTVMLTTTIISSIIPIMAGALFDATGLCTMAFFVTAGIVAVCAVCAFLVRIPKKDKVKADS